MIANPENDATADSLEHGMDSQQRTTAELLEPLNETQAIADIGSCGRDLRRRVAMPKMSGFELERAMLIVRSNLPIVMMRGYVTARAGSVYARSC
ncbi:MAG TPA: hypothetical protein VNA21_00645 [Steroidobacteraceae bacterium]|nr:hypothetical protein [Steroidobacteraceae bacterium]